MAQIGRLSGDTVYPMDHTRVGVSEYGRVGRVEAGRAAVTRRKGGGLTRIAFKQRFDRVPHVQITPERFGGPGTGKVENFWLYLYNDGHPCADEEGFNAGNYIGVGQTVVFRRLAVEIMETVAVGLCLISFLCCVLKPKTAVGASEDTYLVPAID
ncbi:hypothetical protein BDV39DRAFT_210789 [Aspergillus sergii]|uniref:Uncharacterized protein n=1 Tax=Aspergillus sergii TaxID=1034303 RepID=A0A5N6WPI1_9EURO|nr:hypothetical protein BDV39DRAFT_210789 [Aspergillus sergii]